MSIYEEDRAVIEDDGTHHYGLIRPASEKTFAAANPYSLDLPTVDIADLPDSQLVAEWMQIEDQKQQGACQGHAKTSAEETALYRQTGGAITQLSRQFSYITSQLIDGIRGDRGSTMEGGARASQKYGSCLEELAPYSGQYYTQFSQGAYADAKKRTLTTFMKLENYDQVLRWLAHGIGGITIGIGWNSSCEPDGQGRLTKYRSGGGGHALAWLDWTKMHVDSQGRPFIEMFNSWGKRWGFNGRAFLSPAVVDYICKNETVLGYSKMVGDIKPQSYDWIKQSFFS